jgi:hypothetical protein
VPSSAADNGVWRIRPRCSSHDARRRRSVDRAAGRDAAACNRTDGRCVLRVSDELANRYVVLLDCTHSVNLSSLLVVQNCFGCTSSSHTRSDARGIREFPMVREKRNGRITQWQTRSLKAWSCTAALALKPILNDDLIFCFCSYCCLFVFVLLLLCLSCQIKIMHLLYMIILFML